MNYFVRNINLIQLLIRDALEVCNPLFQVLHQFLFKGIRDIAQYLFYASFQDYETKGKIIFRINTRLISNVLQQNCKDDRC